MTTPASPLIPVKFTAVGRVHAYPAGADVEPPRAGEAVIVETAAGPTFGTVVRSPTVLLEKHRPSGESTDGIVRMATREDVLTRFKQEHREREVLRVATMKAREHGLQMKIARVEQAFDASRITVFFTADARVDFRDLVKELAAEFHARIEMRQIGVRDEAKMIGGYGTCGRPLCCTTFLQTFEPVSIKMAKQQDLSLNPSKLSGVCGRLKCCLRYELPNAKGAVHGGCGSEGGCHNPSGCGTGCGSCRAGL